LLPVFSRRVTFSACLTERTHFRPHSHLLGPHSRHRAGDPTPGRSGSPRDITGLELAAQMYAAPYDLLAAGLGATEDRVRGIVARWRQAGLAESGRFSAGPPWCWATQQGLRHLGYPWTAEPPALSRLARTRAVLACRLWLESVETWQKWHARWRCERQIRADTPGAGGSGHVPAAEVIWPTVEGSPRSGESWAVEVELTPEPLTDTQAILSGLLDQPYSHILYLCAPATIAVVSHVVGQLPPEQAPRVTVQPVPSAALTAASHLS
jgi:hypothetical protein